MNKKYIPDDFNYGNCRKVDSEPIVKLEGRPHRETKISDDEILNLVIVLNVCDSVDSFIKEM